MCPFLIKNDCYRKSSTKKNSFFGDDKNFYLRLSAIHRYDDICIMRIANENLQNIAELN